jgi:hypothetical protein
MKDVYGAVPNLPTVKKAVSIRIHLEGNHKDKDAMICPESGKIIKKPTVKKSMVKKPI